MAQGRNHRSREQRSLKGITRCVAFHGVQSGLLGGVRSRIAADEAVDEGCVEALPLLEVGRVGGAARVRFHECAQDVLMGEPAVRQARVGVRPPGRRVDGVAAGGQVLRGLSLQDVGRVPLYSCHLARDFEAVGVVFVVAIPVVGVNDKAGPNQVGGAGDGACFGLMEHAPITVEVGPHPARARVCLGPVRVYHRHQVQGDMTECRAQGRVAAPRQAVDQAQNGLGGSRLVAVLAAQNQHANGLEGVGTGAGEAHQPQVPSALGGLAHRDDTNEGAERGVGLELNRHAGIRGDVGLGRGA